MEHSNKFIEYYGAHEISPVKQDLSDLELHYAKREKLYRQLGIPCITFDQKKILEIGPGSGYNTLAFFAWGGVCTLVEPNKAGIAEMKKLFADYEIPTEKYTIKECTIEQADIAETFDLVIAEGFLHSIDNGEEILKQLMGYVKSGGVIVITCMDVMSMFVEQMKRLICQILIKDITDYDLQVEKCVEFFAGQMEKVKGMSRSVEDWVKDDMLNPAFNCKEALSMEKALKIFPDNFSFLGSSQRIFTDYSWYKDLEYKERKNMIQQYQKKRHNFLMTGLNETILSEEDSIDLEKGIRAIRNYAIEYEEGYEDQSLDKIIKKLGEIRHIMSTIDQACEAFVIEVREILEKLRDKKQVTFEKYSTFYTAVGRTQQYLSMVKKK